MLHVRARLAAAALASLLALSPAGAAWASPPRPPFHEGKADFGDKELALTYAFGPGSVDFALLRALSVGVAVDQVFGAQDWYYRATYKLYDSPESGLAIALNLGALQTREMLPGNQFRPPVWGYQGGVLVSLATDSGLIFRGGFQLYNTNWGDSSGQAVLVTPEIAYRYGLIEISLQPNIPFTLSLNDVSWVGVRLRLGGS